MLKSSTLNFLRALKQNNNRNWFEANRTEYENAKSDFALMVEEIILSVSKVDPSLADLKLKDCTFRINRDVRFSKDKSPYKTNMAALFSKGGKKAMVAGYYFHCEPGQSFTGGGFYTPMPAELSKIRQEIDYNFDEWSNIIQHKKFKAVFKNGLEVNDSLKRPPKGYDEENPAIHYLKMKGYIVTHPVEDGLLTGKNAVKEINRTFEAMKPLIDFLNHAVA